MTNKHNFVTISRRIYAFDSLDKENRVFVGFKLTKQIVDDLLDGKLDDLDEPINRTVILFREQGDQDVYIRDAVLDDFKRLHSYIYSSSMQFYTEEEYNQALKDVKKYENRGYLKRKLGLDGRIERARNRIISYEDHIKAKEEYEQEVKKRDAWLLLVKEKWF